MSRPEVRWLYTWLGDVVISDSLSELYQLTCSLLVASSLFVTLKCDKENLDSLFVVDTSSSFKQDSFVGLAVCFFIRWCASAIASVAWCTFLYIFSPSNVWNINIPSPVAQWRPASNVNLVRSEPIVSTNKQTKKYINRLWMRGACWCLWGGSFFLRKEQAKSTYHIASMPSMATHTASLYDWLCPTDRYSHGSLAKDIHRTLLAWWWASDTPWTVPVVPFEYQASAHLVHHWRFQMLAESTPVWSIWPSCLLRGL